MLKETRSNAPLGRLVSDGSLLSYMAGAVDASISTAGAALRRALERWQAAFSGPVDFAAEGLLDGADDPDAREDLLRQLYAAGASLDDLRGAAENDRLALLPVEAVLRAENEYTLEEMADGVGLGADVLARRISALGISKPEADSVFHEYALEGAAALKELQDAGIPDDGIDEICRTSGRAVGSVAEAVRDVFGETFIQAGDSELDLGLRYAAAARRMAPVFEPLLRFTLAAHLLQLIRSDVVSRTERATGTLPGAHEIAVCFADLSEFTSAGARLTAEELGELVRRFDDLVQECTPPGARHVKTVGDAAMIVSPDPDAAIDAALRLIKAAQHLHHFPEIHAGITIGRAVARDGDWHGHPVNIASRLADSAPPGRIYVSEEVANTVQRHFRYVGRRRLKGINGAMPVFLLLTSDPTNDGSPHAATN